MDLEIQPLENTLEKRRIALPDGRYLIFYSFNAPRESPTPEETGVSAFDEPYEMLDV